VRGKTLLAAVIVVVIVVGFLIFSIESPAIVEIEIEGGGRIGTSRVQALIGFDINEPWHASFSERAENELHGLPEVRDVSVSSHFILPYGIKVVVDIDEREPFAVVASGDQEFYWVDREGEVISLASHQTVLPVLEGIQLEEREGKSSAIPSHLSDVLREIFMMPGSLLARFSEIRVNAYDLDLMSHEGWSARIPAERVKGSLSRLQHVLEVLGVENLSDWTVIDLRFEGEVTLR